MPEVMNGKQLAQYLGVSYSYLRELSSQEGKLPPYFTVGGLKRWYLSTVRAWMENNTAPDSLSGSTGRL